MKFKWVATIALAFILLVSLEKALPAHDWYDHDCCHDRDCAPVVLEEQTSKGLRLVDDKGNEVFQTPTNRGKLRASRDNHTHICSRPGACDEFGTEGCQPRVLICIYRPMLGGYER